MSRKITIKEFPAGKYVDEGDLLLYAAFTILVNFVESKGFKHVDWHTKEMGRRRFKNNRKIFKLYYWWKYGRVARVEPFTQGDPEPNYSWIDDDDFWTKYPGGQAGYCFEAARKRHPEHYQWLDAQGKLQEEYDKEDQAMLKRLVNLRNLLWT